jgi:hypothetical protein
MYCARHVKLSAVMCTVTRSCENSQEFLINTRHFQHFNELILNTGMRHLDLGYKINLNAMFVALLIVETAGF